MTNDDLAALLAAATKGPWMQGKNNPDRVSARGAYIADCDPANVRYPRCEANAALIARAPDMAAEVLDLRAKLTEAEKALDAVLNACDQGRMHPAPGCASGGMTIEANIRGSVYSGVPAWPIEEARAALARIREALK